jgi:ubiquinone/menaquinone biosynthesis C-methylase UbiE
METQKKIEFFNSAAKDRDRWRHRNRYYNKKITQLLKFIIPEGSSVLEVGCGTGNLLNDVNPDPDRSAGIDFSINMINIAKQKYPNLTFIEMDVQELSCAAHKELDRKFDFIIMSDVIGHFEDVQLALKRLHPVCHPKTRIVITYHNFTWEWIFKLGEKLNLKMKELQYNLHSQFDLEGLLDLSNFEIIRTGSDFFMPFYIPVYSEFMNKYMSKLFFLKYFCFVNHIIARPIPDELTVNNDLSVSVIIPARNEEATIERAVMEIPEMGKFTEIIFVEGNSKDNTLAEIKRVCEKYKNIRNVKYCVQEGKGKKDAVFKGFDMASGDILMILDADLTVQPKELPKFFDAIASGKGEFINGSRFVYPMERESMRFLRSIANKFFGMLFSWMLSHYFKDILCGTKVIAKSDYEKIKKDRAFLGNFDNYGDFDLILGSYRQNLKIVEVPLHYKNRIYGETNIPMWQGGTILLRAALFAMRKIKFI